MAGSLLEAQQLLQAQAQAQGVQGSTQAQGRGGISLGSSSLAASFISGGSSSLLLGGQQQLSQSALPLRSSSSSAPAPSPALPASVGEWMRRHGTQGEKENLVALLALIASFQERHGLTALQPAAALEGGDSLVVPLGPSLKIGLRVYV